MGWTGARLARHAWFLEARLAQYPLLDPQPPTWLVIGGRGAGKTRLGAEWVNALVRGLPPFAPKQKHRRLALIGETLADVRDVMVDGPSGIIGVSQPWRPRYEPSRRRLVWENGAVATIFSSEDPESLRGHQFEAAWCDEAGKWRNADACFDMLQFGLRLGDRRLDGGPPDAGGRVRGAGDGCGRGVHDLPRPPTDRAGFGAPVTAAAPAFTISLVHRSTTSPGGNSRQRH